PPRTDPDAPPVRPLVPCPCLPQLPADGLPLPCPGPGCSAPAGPDSVTAPTPVQSSDDWATPAAAFWLIPSTSVLSLADPGSEHTVRQPSAVFRPPRFP